MDHKEIKVYYETRKTYLIYIIHTDYTTSEKFAHTKEQLDKIITELCSKDNDDKIYDFRIFERVNIEFE